MYLIIYKNSYFLYAYFKVDKWFELKKIFLRKKVKKFQKFYYEFLTKIKKIKPRKNILELFFKKQTI